MSRVYDNYADLITFTRASSATYLDSDGLLKTASTNVPRIEYDSDGNRLGLLVEEARTNLFTQSENLTSGLWGASFASATLTANDRIAPDGTLTADKVSSTNFAGIAASPSVGTTIASKSFTVSVWVYAETTFNFDIRTRGNGSVQEPQNTTVSTVAGQWVRVSSTHTFTASADGSTMTVFLYTAPFGVTESNTLWFWGAQLEAGSFPTSYMPTNGSTATRSADVASIGVSEFGYNQSEGTLVGDIVGLVTDPDNNPRIAAFSDGTNNNRISLLRTSSNDTAGLFFVKDGNFALTGSAAVNDGDFAGKYAGAYKVNDVAAVTKGGVVGVDLTSPAIPVVDRLNIGSSWSISSFLNGHIKSIKYYPRRLTNAQLQELTR